MSSDNIINSVQVIDFILKILCEVFYFTLKLTVNISITDNLDVLPLLQNVKFNWPTEVLKKLFHKKGFHKLGEILSLIWIITNLKEAY